MGENSPDRRRTSHSNCTSSRIHGSYATGKGALLYLLSRSSLRGLKVYSEGYITIQTTGARTGEELLIILFTPKDKAIFIAVE